MKVWSNYKSEAPRKPKNKKDNTITPSLASANPVLSTASAFTKDGFRQSYFPVGHEALLYTTIDSKFLDDKLTSFPYKYEGGSVPVFKLGEVDKSYILCNHCRKWHWSCHEFSFRKYCHKAVLRYYTELNNHNVCPKGVYVVFVNFYNRSLEFFIFDEIESGNESILGGTSHLHHAK